jgi:hypothetical protein
LNFPGSWSDGELARQLYRLLKTVPDGFSIAADSAFCRADMAGQILRPLKNDEIERYSRSLSVQRFIATIKRHRLALSIRQSAEWGMRSIQCVCGRLQHKLDARAPVRRALLDLCVRYFNYRTRTVGLNQTRTVYHPEHSSLVLNRKLSYYYRLRTQAVY